MLSLNAYKRNNKDTLNLNSKEDITYINKGKIINEYGKV